MPGKRRRITPASSYTLGKVSGPDSGHIATVILFHGLGGEATYWNRFLQELKRSGVATDRIRWVPLNAPTRLVYGDQQQAWFTYTTMHGKPNKEDSIDEAELLALREELHDLMHAEARRLEAVGGMRKVLLVGSSQGGQAALDAALTLTVNERSVAGVAMLRSLALSVTAKALPRPAPGQPVAVLAVSSKVDEEFGLNLVKRNLDSLQRYIALDHEVLPDLSHYPDYSDSEIAFATKFIIRRLQLQCPPREKSWAALNDIEKADAEQLLGMNAEAWDDASAEVWSKPWRQLSSEQRDAVEHLGCCQPLWARRRGETAAFQKSWAELKGCERNWAEKLLGVSTAAWDDGESPVWNRDWQKLTQQQRKAAEHLGYCSASWKTSDKSLQL